MDVAKEPSLLGNSKNLVFLDVFALKVESVGTPESILSYNDNNEENISLESLCAFFQACQHAIMLGPFILKLRRSC